MKPKRKETRYIIMSKGRPLLKLPTKQKAVNLSFVIAKQTELPAITVAKVITWETIEEVDRNEY